MVDRERLREIIEDSGMTLEALGRKSGVKPYTITRRLNGDGDFTAPEIVGLSKALKLTKTLQREIFLR